jgi:hypothetical protein
LKHFKILTSEPTLQYIKLSLLACLLICVSVLHYSLRENAQTTESLQVYWSQPAMLDEPFPQLVGPNNWQLNYAQIEEILWQLKLDDYGKLVINSQTAERLHQVSNLLPFDMNTKEWQRLIFLLDKSFYGGSGEQVFTLLKNYFFYQQQYNLSLSAVQHTKGNKQLELIKVTGADNKQLQVECFGSELAAKLFTKQNITTDYLNKRRGIKIDPSLTSTQKKQQLLVLEDRFKNQLLKQ